LGVKNRKTTLHTIYIYSNMLRAKSTEWKRAFLAVVGGRLTGQGKGRSPDNSLTADFFKQFFFSSSQALILFFLIQLNGVPINIDVNQNI